MTLGGEVKVQANMKTMIAVRNVSTNMHTAPAFIHITTQVQMWHGSIHDWVADSMWVTMQNSWNTGWQVGRQPTIQKQANSDKLLKATMP